MKEIVIMIVKYLRKELESGTLNADAAEGVEVAVQCIESAYGITEEHIRFTESCLEDYVPLHLDGRVSNVPEAQREEAESLKLVGNNLMKEGKFEDAIQHYTRAIELDSQNAVYFCNRAAAFIKLSNYAAAVSDCNEAIRIDPQYSKAHSRLGYAYGAIGNHLKAKESYKRALELEPENESYKASYSSLEEQLAGSSATNYLSGIMPGLNFTDMLRDPSFINIAGQILAEPGMQDAVRRFLVGQSYPMRNVEDLLSVFSGQEMASRPQQESGTRMEAPAGSENNAGGMPSANPNGQSVGAPNLGQQPPTEGAAHTTGSGDAPTIAKSDNRNEPAHEFHGAGDAVPQTEAVVTPLYRPSSSGDGSNQ